MGAGVIPGRGEIMIDVRQCLVDALDKLDVEGSVNQIELYLRNRGVHFDHAQDHRSRDCPLAQWLIRLGFTRPVVVPLFAFAVSNSGKYVSAPLPSNVRDFVFAYDSGCL